MKKFNVLAKVVTYCEIEVEAETAEQAEGLAKEMDAGDFIPCDPEQGYFEVCNGEAKEVVSEQ